MKCYFLPVVLLFLVSLFSCKPDRGKPCIDEQAMRDILVDLHTAQAVLAREQNIDNSLNKPAYFNSILVKHGVTEQVFDSAVAWYSVNPDIYSQVYDEVIKIIEAKRDSID